MDEKKEILKRILESKLLAPSLEGLAKTLGLKSKSSIYRIIKGDVKATAISTFCQALDKVLDNPDQEVIEMGQLLQSYDYLSSRLKNETIGKDPEDVVLSLTYGDYSRFSKKFVEETLPEIMRYSRDMPIGFHRLLIYYYIRKRFTTFYLKKLTFRQQCERVLLPLAESLQKLYFANKLGKEYMEALTNRNVYENQNPTLWTCIIIGGYMLMNYSNPNTLQEQVSNYILLPGVEERSYWLTDNPEQIIMALNIEGQHVGSGFYNIFSLDFSENTLQALGMVTFDSDGITQVVIGNDEEYIAGCYKFEKRNLLFYFPDDANPLGVGNHWRLLNIETIQEVKNFNDQLSDTDIHHAIQKKQGVEDISGYKVKDVSISRHEVTLYLESGKRLTIPNDAHDFLDSIKPFDTVIIVRRIKDDFKYVAWTERNCIIPLSEFTVHPKEQ